MAPLRGKLKQVTVGSVKECFVIGRKWASTSTSKIYSKSEEAHLDDSAFHNVDYSLHDETSRKTLENWCKFSQETGKVVLHSSPKGLFEYSNAQCHTGKVESYVKYNNINYIHDASTLACEPIKKIPNITYNDYSTSDSSVIISRLNKEFNINNNSDLNEIESALYYSYHGMLEQLYWTDGYRRFMDNDNCLEYFEMIFVDDKEKVDYIMTNMLSFIHDVLYKQGISRLSGDVVYNKQCNYINSILDYMKYNNNNNNSNFMFGDKVSLIDFEIYGFLGSIYSLPFDFPNTKISNGELPRKDEVMGYLERMEYVCDENYTHD